MIENLLDACFEPRVSFIDETHTTAFRLFNGFLEGCADLCIDVYAQTILIHDYSNVPSGSLVKTAADWVLKNIPWIDCILVKYRNSRTNDEKRGVVLHGQSPATKIYENGAWYAVDLVMNRDSSFYLDTRNLRSWAQTNLAGKNVLNTFAYTGSLGVAALTGGAARVVQLDRNNTFLGIARRSYELNGIPVVSKDFLAQDFFPAVSQLKRSNLRFDCVFLDPPFFASTSKGTVDLEAGSTRLINKVRPLINDGGWLVTINNALYVSGKDYLDSLSALCTDGYLSIEEFIPIPDDFTGYPQTIKNSAPSDPAPFNHSTKIAILRVRKKHFTEYK